MKTKKRNSPSFGPILPEMPGLAFDLAEMNKISHNFSKNIKVAG
jgi:hypothetical protein